MKLRNWIKIIIILGILSTIGFYSAMADMSYTIELFANDYTTYAHGINDLGQVSGYAKKSKSFPYRRSISGSMKNLGLLPGHEEGYAHGINDLGQVVGYTQLDGGYQSQAFLYTDGVGLTGLGSLDGFESKAFGINNLGEVVGASCVSDKYHQHAFLYNELTGMEDIGMLPGHTVSSAYDINDRGQIVGLSALYGNTNYRAFLYSEDTKEMIDLGTLGGNSSVANAINNSGVVVGNSRTADGYEHAFMYSEDLGMIDLGTVGDYKESFALGINDSGQIVGYLLDRANRNYEEMFLYSDGVMMVIQDLMPDEPDWYLARATAINNSGQITGWGVGNEPLNITYTHLSYILTPTNGPPTADAGGPYSVDEGSLVIVNASGSDPNGDPLTFEWDLDNDGTFETPGQNVIFSALDINGPGIHRVMVQVTDSHGLSATDEANININNISPEVNIATNAIINEGNIFAISGSFTDPGADTWTATVDYGDNSGEQTLALNGKTFSLSHQYLDNPPSPATNYVVLVTINDGNDSGISNPINVTVNNVAPTLGPITTPTDLVLVNTSVTASADFTDPGTLDTHVATWDWGDGNLSDGTINETNGSGTASGSHTYTTAGVYTLTLTVTDDDGVSTSEEFKFLVIHDPEGEFVTGGGWIDSPDGSYTYDTSITGKATLSFVLKYQKGATVPTGNTQFNFHADNMNFTSTEYEWLVIAGSKAQYKGSGTINGDGDYRFILTAIDGKLANDGVDRFRIKIIDKTNDSIVYDNQMGTPDDANPTTAISGGSIVIHKDNDKNKAKAAPAMVSNLPVSTKLLTAYPNPANPEVWIPYRLARDNDVMIRIYSAAGQVVRTLELGHKPAGIYASNSKSAYWDGRNEAGESVKSGVYFYSIQAGEFTDMRKVLILK